MKKRYNRRLFIKLSAAGAGLISTLSSFRLEKIRNNQTTQLKIAGYDYPRVQSIVKGKETISGYSYQFVKGGVGDLNTMAIGGSQEYDITEIGIVPFINAYANDGFDDFYLLPIFPLRVFRHKSIFIRSDSGIKTPEDLKGKKIGTPGYSSSSLTWIRGMLQDEYGVSPKDVKWVISSKDTSAKISGKVSKQENVIPEEIKIESGPEGMDESELLVSGEVDALFHAVEPAAYIKGDPRVSRLFNDPKTVEQEYFNKTGIFPIMHGVAVKKSLLNSNPNLARQVFDAYSAAKFADYAFMRKLGWAYSSLPWYSQEYEQTRKLMGDDFWTYGMKKNAKTMDTICHYCYDQGLISKKVDYKELFYPESLDFE